MHSYHIFYFPFKWEVKGKENLLFSEQVNLKKIIVNPYSNWDRTFECVNEIQKDELYNEKQYFYKFTHPILYDDGTTDSIIRHYEHKDPKLGDTRYIIKKKDGKLYSLKLDAISLNLYSTGVGILNFYLENNDYPDKEDVLMINQFGRRIFPPFIQDTESRIEIAEFIEIQGLSGTRNYREDFSDYTNKTPYQLASFIKSLITDFSDNIEIEPVIDDRMFVNSTYSNKALVEPFLCFDDQNQNAIDKSEEAFQKFCFEDSFWYKYLFADASSPTCRNKAMRNKLVEDHTYLRWQQYGSLFGFSRYSLVLLADINEDNGYLPVHMRCMYSRMIEMVLIIRASILKFSGETTEVSKLINAEKPDRDLINRISSIYKEYIGFVNQYYFREVTAQDQGIELYNLILKTLRINDYIKDLDNEIEELHNYVSLLEDNRRNTNATYLNIFVVILTIITVITGLPSINNLLICSIFQQFGWLGISIGLVVCISGIIIFLKWLIKRFK